MVCFWVGGLSTDSGGLGGGPPNRRRRSPAIFVPRTPLQRHGNVKIITYLHFVECIVECRVARGFRFIKYVGVQVRI